MLKKFGTPGDLTAACSDPKGRIVKRIKYGIDVGPFKVSGLDYAIEGLRQLFGDVADSGETERHSGRKLNAIPG